MDGLGDEGDGEAIRLPTAEYLAPSAQHPNCPDKADMVCLRRRMHKRGDKIWGTEARLKGHFV